MLLLAACASSPEVKDEQLAKLPVEERQALLDEERAVDVARSNVEAAQGALEDARRFKSMVGDEQAAAEREREAAEKNASLQKQGDAQQAAKAAEDRKQLAADNLSALEAKAEYADRLVTLREAELEQRNAELERATQQRERAEYEALKARGMAGDLDAAKFDEADRKIDESHRQALQQVQEARSYADAAKGRWEQAQSEYEAAGKRIGTDQGPSAVPPPAPKPIQEGAKDQPSKDKKNERK